MRGIEVRHHGGPDVLQTQRLAEPKPGPGQLTVSVGAAGVNFIDVYMRTGAYPTPVPFVPGQEGAGTVLEVGEQTSGFASGDRVAWAGVGPGYAEKVAIPAAQAVPIPGRLSDAAAAAVLLQGMTAHYLVEDVGHVAAGDTVLVHAAAGGVGLLLCQLASERGARVIGVVGSATKEESARRAGAEIVLRYGDDLPAAVREHSGGRGAEAVFDGVGAPTFDASLESLRPRGMLALFGQAGGPVPPVDPQRLNAAGSVFLTRPKLQDYTADRPALLARAAAVLDAAADERLHAHVDETFSLDQAEDAHRKLESRSTVGKLLLLPTG